MSNKFCPQCGTQIAEDAMFCTKCGAQQPKSETKAPAAEPEVKAPAAAPAAKPTKKVNVKNIVSLAVAATACLLSLIMMILAFCPILNVKMSDEEERVKISPLDNVTFLFDAMLNQDYDDIEDSNLYEKYEDVEDDYYDDVAGEDYEDLDAGERAIYNKYHIYSLRLSMRTENFAMRPTMIISALVAIVYVLFAIALFLVSSFYFLSKLCAADGIGEKLQGLQKALGGFMGVAEKLFIPFLCAFPLLMIVLWSSMYMTWGLLVSSYGTVMSGPAVWIIVLSVLAIGAIVADKIVGGEVTFNRVLITRAVSFVCALILMLLAFAPVFSSTVETTFSGKSKEKKVTITLDASALAYWNPSVSEIEDFEDIVDLDDDEKEYYMSYQYRDFSSYKLKEVEKGEADGTNAEFLYFASVIGGFYIIDGLFGFVTVLYVLVILAAAIIMWHNLVQIVGGKSVAVLAKISKIVAVAAAGLALLLIIILLALTGGVINEYLDNDYEYSLGIGAGIIFMTLFAVVNLIFSKIEGIVCNMVEKAKKPAEETKNI